MSKQIMKIYIPRILGGVTQKMIIHTFHRLSIGNVYYIDMYRKINQNKNLYYFAFLEIELYNTLVAKRILADLNDNIVVKLIYDEDSKYYWEVKRHVPKTERHNKSSVMPVSQAVYMNATGMVEEQTDLAEDDFDYETNLQGDTYTYNMWDAKNTFWSPANAITLL